MAQENVSAILLRMPAQSAQDAQTLFGALLKLGAPGIAEIADKIVPIGGQDVNARFALSGLAKYASQRPDEERRLVSEALAAALKKASEGEVKDFLLEQLLVVGGDEAMDTLAGLVADPQVGDRAIGALERIGTDPAKAALMRALDAPDQPHLARIAKAMGVLRVESAVPRLTDLAKSSDAPVREAALFALARIAAPQSADVLREAVRVEAPLDRARNMSLYLQFAEGLLQRGQKADAERIAQELTGAPDVNVRCAALKLRVSIAGKAALAELLAAMDDPEKEYRGAALLLAAQIPGKAASSAWAAKSAKVSTEVRGEILSMLGARDDSGARSALRAALKDEDAEIRAVALASATRHGGVKAVKPVSALLASAQTPEEAQAASAALLRLPGDRVAKCANKILMGKAVSAEARKAAIGVLAARKADAYLETVFAQTKNEDEGVRVAALKALGALAGWEQTGRLVGLLVDAKSDAERLVARDAVVASAKQGPTKNDRVAPLVAARSHAPAPAHGAVIEALVELGGDSALQAVLEDTKHADATVRTAAFSALGAWKTGDGVMALVDAWAAGSDAETRAAVLEAALRQGQQPALAAEDRAWLHQALLADAKDDKERQAILESLATVRSVDAAVIASSCLDNAALQGVAADAMVRIVCPPKPDAKGLEGTALAYLNQALPKVTTDPLKKQAADYLGKFPAESLIAPAAKEDESGFTPIFNGHSLEGWVGDVKGYMAEFGKLVSKQGVGGNIYTEKEFGDFVLRLEFKLTPGANNGLGIRSPLNCHVATDGIELQILDDTNPKYATLKPYQFHGSVYGVVPAKRGFLKPVGEWNRQEVTAKGRQLTIVLNGETILDVDLDEIVKDGTPDGKAHPGLALPKGHLAFCGHNDVLEFRNLRVKPLD